MLRQGTEARSRNAAPGAFLVTHLPHIRYLTGFTGSNAWLLLRSRSAVLFTDPRYREQAAAEVRGMRVSIVKGTTFTEALTALRLHAHLSVLAFEADHLTATVAANLKRALRPLRMQPVSGLVEFHRMVKGEDEIERINRAINISEQAFLDLLPMLRPGVTEIDIAAELSYRQRRLGADGDAFPPIVLFGARTSLVHGQPSPARLTRRAPVLLDFGCRVDGYGSDITRTLHVGPAPRRFREVYDIVREAQEAGCAALRAGIEAARVDDIVRGRIADAGWGAYFEHGLGHGIGLETHEAPHLSWRNGDLLEEGQVVTVEPGVYLPGKFGVRIEDDLLVLSDGAECLTTLPRTLLEVEP